MVLSKRTLIILLIDFIGITFSLAFLYFTLQIKPSPLFIFSSYGLLFLANFASGAYNQLWRYTSFREIQNIFLSNVFSFSTLLILHSLKFTKVPPLALFNFFSFYFL